MRIRRLFDVNSPAEAIKKVGRFFLLLNYYLLSRLGGITLFVWGPFFASPTAKAVTVVFMLVNLLPTVVTTYMLSIVRGMNQSEVGTLVVLAIIIDIAGFLTNKQAYISAHGRRPARYPKVTDLYTRWFTLLLFGIGVRVLLFWQLFIGGPLKLVHQGPFATIVGFVFVPTTLCANAVLLHGNAILLARGIALIVGGMADLSVYMELQNSHFDRRQRMLELEWQKGLAARDPM